MRRTQPSAQANQRRNLLGPVRDRAITKPIPTNRSTASTGAGISRSERLVPHRSPPIDLTSDAEDDGERFSAAEEDEENENEGDEDEEDEYYDDEDVRVANASPGRANRLSTAKFCLVEERLCATSTDANAVVLGYRDKKTRRGFEWDEYEEQWSIDGTVSIHGSGEEDNYKVLIRKTKLKRGVPLSR